VTPSDMRAFIASII